MLTKLSKAFFIFFVIMISAVKVLSQQITADELMGTYGIGHRYGASFLTLEADGKYINKAGDCTTEYFDSGTYSLSDGVLNFTILKQTAKQRGQKKAINLLDPKSRKKFYGDMDDGKINREFKLVPIKWSGRMYLIYEDNLNDFVNAINFGIEPRSDLMSEPYYGSFYLREGDEEKKVIGKPQIPASWLDFLLENPITALITEIEIDGKIRTATLNKGSKDGLKIGMRLLSKDEAPSPWRVVEIISVQENSSKVRIYSDLKAGDILSTKYEPKSY